jgi:uncharacterized protein YecE (DUF72 family)
MHSHTGTPTPQLKKPSFALGCAIWAYKGWIGELFPAGSHSSDFLRLYGQRFLTVEGNTTFYSIPDAATVQRWAAETPAGFQFCLKLPRSITHGGPLAPHIAAALRFIDQMQGLGDRLGPFFAQLPPHYGPQQFADLTTFLTALPRDAHDFALEVRHPDWFQPAPADRLNHLLERLGMGRVILDTRPIYDCADDPQVASERKKPRLPLQPKVTAPFSIVRYISHPDRDFNRTYLQEWVERIDQWQQQGIRIYVFVHCPVEAKSPTNARLFQMLLEQHGVPVPALPWDLLPAKSPPNAEQLSFF